MICLRLVFFTCLYAPYSLAFSNFNLGLTILDNVTNLIFFIDIIVNLLSAYQDQDFKLIVDPKVRISDLIYCQMTASHYLRSWFLFDLLSVIPFDLLLSGVSVQSLSFNKMAKMYRLVKLMKVSRMLKVIKDKMTIFEKIQRFINIGTGTRRLLFLMIILFLLQHVTSCLW
jgi:hypothetical protein